MKFLAIMIILFLCTACDKARFAIAGVDLPEIIDNYQPVTPVLVGKSVGTVVSLMNKANQIDDEITKAIIKEYCAVEKHYREYWMARQWRLHGIDYRRACESLDGEIMEPLE